MDNLIMKRYLLSSLIVSIVFQLIIIIGLYILVYIEPLPRLITDGNVLLQKINSLLIAPSGELGLVRSFILGSIHTYQSTATLLATIATLLLICVLVQIFVFIALAKSKSKG